MKEYDNKQIQHLKSYLEEYLNWGDVEHWSTRNFDHLSERIFDATSIQLSVSTLKRFVGKVAYEGKPAPATLDAIAAFVGYQNYADYCSRSKELEKVEVKKVSTQKLFIYATCIMMVVGAGVALAFLNLSTFAIDHSQVSFSIRKVTTGLPNTVVFDYDVSKVPVNMVEIQQDWDSTKRHRVDPGKNIFTHYYEYPGYYNAKLVLNGSIVKEEDLYIPSEGWMSVIAYLEDIKPPRYLKDDEFQSDSVLRVSEVVYREINGIAEDITLDFYNAVDEPQFDFKNFKFKATIRFNLQSGRVPCEFRKLVFFGTKKFIRIPLSIPGCVSQNKVKLGSHVIDGTENDLSALSVESGKWSKVEVENKANHLSIYLDDELAFESTLIDDFGKLAGLRISFSGSGEVKDLLLSSGGNEVLAME